MRKARLVSDGDRAAMLAALKKLYPDPRCALHHRNPIELLVSTILSAQCTDERVNMVTPALFAKYKTARDYAEADPLELAEMIRSTGFFNSKTKNIMAAMRANADKHGGKVPRSMEALTALPGVGRKTANVVLGNAYGIASGIVVDTHVERLAQRLGWSAEKTPEKIELDLCGKFPESEWINLSHRLIFHGRETCSARRPKCERCALAEWCPRIGVETRR
ncbi:endonuclease III [bacterium]|nr:endonuclease III [bacterium]